MPHPLGCLVLELLVIINSPVISCLTEKGLPPSAFHNKRFETCGCSKELHEQFVSYNLDLIEFCM